ncbi:MAG: sigma-70 family RNA polymerase sigma factor [Deltaproteobacteria bacterium]|nr:sigma-70 family RNA polymerase sigma factor [Deltaproteobacteria bacterium]
MRKQAAIARSFSDAQRRWPEIHVEFEKFRNRVLTTNQDPNKMALQDLYFAVALGDKSTEAWEAFFLEYHNYVQQIASRFAKGPDLEDIVQQFIEQIPDKIDKYRGLCSLRGWLGVVVPNFSRDYFRRKRHHVSLHSEGSGDGTDRPQYSDLTTDSGEAAARLHDELDRKTCEKFVRELLAKAIGALTPDWRLMIKLKFFDGLTNREIAATVFRTGEYNVSKWLKKALAKTQKRLVNLAALTGPNGVEKLRTCLELYGL